MIGCEQRWPQNAIAREGKRTPLLEKQERYQRWSQTKMASERWRKVTTTDRNDHQEAGSKTNVRVLLAALKACSRTRNLERGKKVHAEAVECGHDCNLYIANALINMFAKCGSMVDAQAIFDGIKRPNVVSWNLLILGYADNDQGHIALDLFTRMRSTGPAPDCGTFVAAFKSCTSFAVKEGASRWVECRNRGKDIQNFALESGCNSDVYVQNTAINMYAKCGSMVDAREVFDLMKQPTVVSWSTLILGYAANGQSHTALEFFSRMRAEGPAPNSVTFLAAIKSCTSLANEGATPLTECRDLGKTIHDFALKSGCSSDVVQSTLIEMYAKCRSMEDARDVFDNMNQRDVVSWNVLILGYADNGRGDTALDIFAKMRTEGPAPNSITLLAILKACSCIAETEGTSRWAECRDRGKGIHNFAVENGCKESYVQNTLIDVYAKCGSMVCARQVFDSTSHPTVVSWTALILGYSDNGEGHTGLELFTRMRTEGPPPNSITFVAVIKACTSLLGVSRWAELSLDSGKRVHNFSVETGCNSNVQVQGTLIDMYVKCNSMMAAREVFDGMKHRTVVSWNVMIMGYAENGQGHIALDLFNRLRSEGPVPDSVTFVAALKACASLAVKGANKWEECRNRGKEIQNFALANGCSSDAYVQNTLIDMYAKCGSMVDAREVFDSMKRRDVVSWNVLILGYAENDQGQTALDLFTKMRFEGPALDDGTFKAALKACGLIGALEFGRTIHSELGKDELDVILVTCLVDFYAKCGSLVEAQSVFNLHSKTRNIVTWTALLAGYSNCGDIEEAFRLYQDMQDSGLQPNSVTFLCILTCCSRAGLVEKGKECFDSMLTQYGIVPTIEHYNCMVDILGRANKLEEAMALLERMPCSPNDVTWKTVLGACRKWKNVEIGKVAFQSMTGVNDIYIDSERDVVGLVNGIDVVGK